jgi:TP901 family phage tail tape measure protein
MAESKYSLAGAGMDLPSLNSTFQTFELSALSDPLAQLGRALNTVSLDIRLLTAGQGKLGEAVSALTAALLSPSGRTSGTSVPASETKSTLMADVEQRPPPQSLKSAMAMQTAMFDLGQKLRSDPDQLQEMSNDNQRIAADKRVAASGTTGVQLAQAQLAAFDSGLVKDIPPEGRRQALTDFAGDAGVMASAFRISVKEAGEIITGWRTSMGLDRAQRLDLADASNHLATLDGFKAKAADIGSIVQRSGAAGMAAGMTPEQTAAIAAALLNAGVGKDEANASLKTLSATLSKGDNATVDQRAALAQLGFDPAQLASEMRKSAPQTISSLQEALEKKTAVEQTALLRTLFEGDEGIGKLFKAPKDLQAAFAGVSDKSAFATSKLGDEGSVAQTAEARGNTSQVRWNAMDANLTRLDAAIANAVSPFTDLAMLSVGGLASGLSHVVESLPKFGAALTLLVAGLATPLRGAILNKLASVTSSIATELLKPDTAIQSPGGEAPGGQDQKIAKDNKPGPEGSKPARPTMRSRLAASVARAKPFTARLGAPLAAASAGYDGLKAVLAGDYKAAAGATGSGIGGLAGGYAGAATGALIGSFIPVPILGTAVGGLIGGLVGSYFGSQGGEVLGESLYSAQDRLQPPDQVSKDLSSAQTQHQQINFSPVIQISGADPAHSEQLVEKVMTQLRMQLHGEFLPLMTNPLTVRRDAALTDGGL